MKQSAKTVTFTGIAGAVAVAGASQAYGTIINVPVPTNLTGVAQGTATGTKREYWDVETGKTTAASTAATDFNFGLYSGTAAYPTEFFTGVYGTGGGVATYAAPNGTYYAFASGKGPTSGTGGTYASFKESTTSYTIMSLTYNGTAYAIQKPGSIYYVGFQFTLSTDGLKHNGWIELESNTYTSAASPGGLTFFAAAYNSVPDGTAAGLITLGQVGTNAVPEPGSLCALAVGAAGLAGVGLKRRRKAALDASLPA